MRKVFVFFLATISFLSVDVQAKTIIAEEGVLEDKYICPDGAVVSEGNVNWDRAGRYHVMYLDETDVSHERNVIILNSGHLSYGYELMTHYATIFESKDIYIGEVLFGEDNDFFVYGSINRGEGYYHPAYTRYFFYVAYYKNGCFMWEDIMYPERYGVFVSACLVPEGIALIGDYDSYNEGRNIVMCIYNKSGLLMKRREILGDGNDFGKEILYHDGVLRFVGTANSHNKDYEVIPGTDYNIIFGTWRPENDIFLLRYVGNVGNDLFYGAIMSGNNLAIYMEFDGAGIYTNEGASRFPALVLTSLQCEVIKYEPVTLGNMRIFGNGDNIVLTRLDHIEGRIILYNYDRNLRCDPKKIIEIPDGMRIYDVKLLFLKSEISLYATGMYKGNTFIIMEPNFKGSFDEERIVYTDKSFYIPGFYRATNGEILYANVSYDRKVINTEGYLHIKKQAKVSTLQRNKFNYNDIYLNNIKACYEEPVYNPYRDEELPFGSYPRIEKHSLGDTEIYLAGSVFCEPFLNIRNYEVYDIGHRLVFGGVGYLNGNPIENLSRIYTPGNYILELIGNCDERRLITFSIDYLSETDADVPNVEKIPDFTLQFTPMGENNLKAGMDVEKIKGEDQPKELSGLMFVSAGAAGLMAGGLLPFKKRRNINA